MNFDENYFIQFINKSTHTSNIKITYEDKQICTAIEAKFLGLFINNTLSWKPHIEYIKSKLSSLCYAVRSVKPYVSLNASENDWLFLFPLCNDLWFIVLGTLLRQYEDFQIAKEIIRIMMVCKCSGSCRKLLFNKEILPLPSQCILSLLLCMIKNSNQFLINSEISHFDTRRHANFHQPSMNLTKYQKVGTV